MRLHNFPLLRQYPIDQPLLDTPAPEQSYRRTRLSVPMLLGGTIFAFILIGLLLGPGTTNFSPHIVGAGPQLASPGAVHWFGTDALGRDLFSRVVSGLSVSLFICIAATAITAIPGILLGLAGGYCRGWMDTIISRLVEVLLSLPGLLLAIVLIARLGASTQTMILALGITGIPTIYRVTRGETISMLRQPFIEASTALGLAGVPLIFRHVLPNIFNSLLVIITMRMGTFLLMGSGLSFIGLGVQPPQAELGALLASGKEYYLIAWWLAAFPGLAIILTVLGFNLLGEGLRDYLDPYEAG